MKKREENIAAITAEIFTAKQYQEFYTTFCDAVSGTPGFWQFAIEAADVFTKLEQRLRLEWDGEYMEAVEGYAWTLIDQSLERDHLLNRAEMLSVATAIIKHENVQRRKR